MRIYFILTALLFIFSLSIPFITNTVSNQKSTSIYEETKAIRKTDESTDQEKSEKTEKISVFKTATKETVETEITEYLIGVVAAEMPASFSPEALKAQAVASYTYAKYLLETNGTDFTITDSSATHQSYIEKSEQKKKWGDNYGLYRSVIENAVKSVSAEYLTYNDKTALTVFHAQSDGYTHSAEEIWGKPVEYLVKIESPSKENFVTECSFTSKEFKALFKNKGNTDITEKDIKKWVMVISKDDNGYINKLRIAGKDFSAIEVKDILSLPSTTFTAKLEDGCFIFTVKGKGHGVGMSQYGAEYMAQEGKSYKEILAHYYPGTELKKE